jgi:hypothetical protein
MKIDVESNNGNSPIFICGGESRFMTYCVKTQPDYAESVRKLEPRVASTLGLVFLE